MTFFNRFFHKHHHNKTNHRNTGSKSALTDKSDQLDKLEKNMYRGYDALRDNISTALLSHMRAELRYRIVHEKSAMNNDSTDFMNLSLWQRFRPAWQTALATVFLSMGLGMYFYANTVFSGTVISQHKANKFEANKTEANKTNVASKKDAVLLKNTKVVAQKNKSKPIKNAMEALHESVTGSVSIQKAKLMLWQKKQWQAASSFVSIPHQSLQGRKDNADDSGHFLFDYWKVNQKRKLNNMVTTIMQPANNSTLTLVNYQESR